MVLLNKSNTNLLMINKDNLTLGINDSSGYYYLENLNKKDIKQMIGKLVSCLNKEDIKFIQKNIDFYLESLED